MNDYIYQNVTVYKTFDVSIMLYFEKNRQGWSNVFGFQKQGVKDVGMGSRVPGVWLRPFSTVLHICMALNNRPSDCRDSDEMPIETWFKLNIKQFRWEGKYTYQIFIDDVLKHSVINNQPMIFEEVNGVIANSYLAGWKTPVGQFKEFQFNSVNI